jgi:hypothetical protein
MFTARSVKHVYVSVTVVVGVHATSVKHAYLRNRSSTESSKSSSNSSNSSSSSSNSMHNQILHTVAIAVSTLSSFV